MRTLLLIALLASSILGYMQFDYMHLSLESGLTFSLSLAAASVITVFTGKEQNKLMSKNWVSVFYIFLGAYLIVHFQKYLDLLLNPYMTDRFNVYSNHHNVLKTAYISVIGLISLLLGYQICRSYNIKYKIKAFQEYQACNGRIFRNISTMFLVSVVLFFMINGNLYLSGNYSQEMLNNMSGSINAYIVLIVDFMMYASIIVKSIELSKLRTRTTFVQYLRSFNIPFYCSLLFYLFLVLVSGDRGPLITYFCAFLYGYLLVSKKKINIASIIVLFISASLIVSVLGVARQDTNRSADKNSEYYQTVMAGESILPLTDELANSNRTAIWAIESTPSTFPYRHGLYTLNNVLYVIPFSNTILRMLGVDLSMLSSFGHSSAFLDWYSQGDKVTSGVGTSTIADIYLDFGPIGVIVVLFVLGLLLRKVDYITKTHDIKDISLWWQVCGIVLFSNAVYMSRSVLLFQLRNVVWLYVVMYVILHLFQKRTHEK